MTEPGPGSSGTAPEAVGSVRPPASAGAVPADPAAQGVRLLSMWRRVRRLPGGGRLFGWLVGRTARYTGSIAPRVLELEAGRCRVLMRDRRRLRNHLGSIHAVALTNLGEMTTGMALTTALPAGVRAIPVGLSMEFLKKARGPVTCTCACGPVTGADVAALLAAPAPAAGEPAPSVSREIEGELRDEEGDVVARFTARWRLGPVPGAAPRA